MESRDSRRADAAVPEDAPPGRLRGRRLLAACGVVAAVAVAWLVCVSGLFDPGRLHVHGPFVDQGGYIRTARFLADTGELRFGLIFPAHAADPSWRPYMPGHFFVLATSYLLFGYGVFTSLLPSLVACVLTSVAVFVVGNRLGGWGRGALASALYLLFPPNLLYAFTAMSEMSFAFACALALASFVHLPRRAQPWALPLVLVVPFLFRETGALYVLPLLGLLRRGRMSWRVVLVSASASVVLLGLLNQWQVSEGKRVPTWAWLVRGGFNYQYPAAPELTIGLDELPGAVAKNTLRNFAAIAKQWRADVFVVPRHGTGLQALLLIVAIVAWLRSGRDPFDLGVLLLVAAFAGLAFGLYDVKAHKLMRGLLFAMPALVVAAAGALDVRMLAARGRPVARATLGLVLAAGLFGSYAGAREAGLQLQGMDAYVADVTAALEDLNHDDESLLVVEFRLARASMDYAVRHYPVPWSFTPEPFDELAHWRLLAGRHRIGTVLLSRWEGERPPASFFGLRYRRTVRIQHVPYHVYQAARKRAAAQDD